MYILFALIYIILKPDVINSPYDNSRGLELVKQYTVVNCIKRFENVNEYTYKYYSFSRQYYVIFCLVN